MAREVEAFYFWEASALARTLELGVPAARLSKRKFVIVCYEKVVRIPLEGDEILRVHGERTQGVVKIVMNIKVEFRIYLVHGATSVAKSPYRLAPLEMQELSKQTSTSCQDRSAAVKELEVPTDTIRDLIIFLGLPVDALVDRRVKLRRVRAMSMTIQSGVKDKILATLSETSKVENAPAEMLCDLDQQMEKRADDGWNDEKVVMDEAHASRYLVPPKKRHKITITLETSYGSLHVEKVIDYLCLAIVICLGGEEAISPVIWAEIGGSSLIGPELVQETTNKVVLVKEKPKAAGDRQKSYADNRRKLLEFEADASLHVPLDEIKVDKTRCFVEEPVKNSDREVKRLKCSRIVVVKVNGRTLKKYVNELVNDGHGVGVTHKERFVLVFVEAAKQSVSVTVSLLWIVSSERDRLIAVDC
ncbi:hypothetical protein Tco_1568964 [Tanacetum coccineum]